MLGELVAAGLVDHMQIVLVPILLGRGAPLWDGLEGLDKDNRIEATTSLSGVTRLTFVLPVHEPPSLRTRNAAIRDVDAD